MSETPRSTENAVTYVRCSKCRMAQLPLGGACTNCRSVELVPEYSEGTGTIYTFTCVHRAPSKVFVDLVPYFILLVDMDEGFRLMANLASHEIAEPAIGDRVRVSMVASGNHAHAIAAARLIS